MSINPAGGLPVPRAQVVLSGEAQDAVTAPQFGGGTSQTSFAVSCSVEVE